MAVRRKNPQTLVLDPTVEVETDGVDTLAYGREETSETTDDVAAALCPTCGELLAWHEEACSVSATVEANKPSIGEPEGVGQISPSWAPSPFTYALGQPVQPVPASRAGRVIWRGQVKERHPRTGLLHRVNVYRLDNGFWDCYFEVELQAVGEPSAPEMAA
ncbi:hypothetical protein [Hymenobacter volaticus]|uniref:Uncharacterized protein n=1 Tax=Hymenobacter volaticus TaxID=2932254 RepID=A0ABY4GDF9_9BACT|nr:hypothetical protein [Hymenobacter volaticus]UOQ68909.1 hypothetical protein MUN86_24695 [Hymenobacter volaticus]